MKPQHEEILNNYAKNLQKMTDLLSRCPNLDADWNICIGSITCDLDIYCYETNRDAVLAEAAKVFGATDWQADMSSDHKSYHWNKTINGVKINIYNAKLLPPVPKSIAVSPNEFPLQLAEVAS